MADRPEAAGPAPAASAADPVLPDPALAGAGLPGAVLPGAVLPDPAIPDAVLPGPVVPGPVVPGPRPADAGLPGAGPAAAPGQRLFAQYAYAPNHLGYCGPADSAALFELAATGHTGADITAVAARFTGAWPYLCVLAELTGIADPLDARLVRAYWTGSALLGRIDQARFGRMLLDRIAGAGARQYWAHLTTALLPEAAPTHCFHVFGVYPWTRLLTAGAPGPALEVLDNCRIRWGRVLRAEGDHAVLRTRRLTWDGQRLRLGEDAEERVQLTAGGRGFVTGVRAGDWLAVHWNWACDRLDAAALWQLRALTDWQLDVTNTRLAREAAAQRASQDAASQDAGGERSAGPGTAGSSEPRARETAAPQRAARETPAPEAAARERAPGAAGRAAGPRP